ncbi:MAG: diaminopropionate ammonia-lyase [Gemmatimonadota bacterium]
MSRLWLKVTENPVRRIRERDVLALTDRWLPPDAIAGALRAVQAWPGYLERRALDLRGLARAASVAAIHYQDEGTRFGLQSFKGWGGGYATSTLLERARARGEGRDESVTVTCATDGNHGRAVAWAAREAGGRSVVYVADIVTEFRASLIAAYGAEIVRSTGNHEVASAECLAAAREHGWYVITETENATEPQIAADILAGYGALWSATLDGLDEPPTHVFVQAGVGGLAATAAGLTARMFGEARPVLTVVEADTADCIRLGLEAGERVTLEGDFDTAMAGLAAGATSTFAWELLSAGADFAVAIRDPSAEATMRRLAAPPQGDPVIEAGASGVAGLAGALSVCADDELRGRFGITGGSRVLVIGTEGPTDPEGYLRIVGRSPTRESPDPRVTRAQPPPAR